MKSEVLSWNDARGFGFIRNPNQGERDIFVHHSSILGRGRKTLTVGAEVEFELVGTEKGPSAKNVLAA